MAERLATYTYQDVLSLALQKMSRNIEDKFAPIICNLATHDIWHAYDFRNTIGVLPNFYVVPGEQDHSSPQVTIPSDFDGIRWANFVQSYLIPPIRYELAVIKDLKLTHVLSLPHAICYTQETQSIRLFPRVPFNISCPFYFVESTYKKLVPKVSAANIASTVLPFDDKYMMTFVEAMKYYALKINDDPRAGTIQTNSKGDSEYTGQLASFYESLLWMSQQEGLNLGDPVIAPAESLISTGSYRQGFLGIGIGL